MPDSYETQICNTALALIGSGVDENYVDDYEGDTTQTAQWCRRLLPQCKDLVLTSFTFVETVKYLAGTSGGGDDTSVVHPDWLYAYPLPSGCKKLLGLVASNNGAASIDYSEGMSFYPLHVLMDWERYQGYVLTNYTTSEFYWWYVYDVAYSELSEATRDAIAHLLAVKMVGAVIKGGDGLAMRRQLYQEYEQFARKNAIVLNQRQMFNPAPNGATSSIDIV